MSVATKTGPHKVRIFIVDDHPMLREGVQAVVNQEPDLIVCGDADNAPGALEAIQRVKPDIAVVDLSLKRGNGLELIKDLQIRFPKLPILVLSMHDESFYAERVLRAGARGYITKAEGTQKLIEGIRRALQGEVFLSEKMATQMISKLIDGVPSTARCMEEALTDRELVVFEMIGGGLSTREIADQLHLSIKTIESHREHIKEKLELENAAELLKHAIQWVRCKGGLS